MAGPWQGKRTCNDDILEMRGGEAPCGLAVRRCGARRRGGYGRDMPLEGQLKARLERALGVVEDHGARGARLLDDAVRLARRIRRFIERGLIDPATDPTALELACYALQLPLKSARLTA